MKQFILNLRLRVKLLLAFGSILVLSAVLMGISFSSIRTSSRYQQVNEAIDSLKIHLLEAEQGIQFFMFEGYKITEFQKEGKGESLNAIGHNLLAIQKKAITLSNTQVSLQDSVLRRAIDDLALVQVYFDSLTWLLKKRGFKDFGLEGELRAAIHAVEQSSFPYSKADMLTLRRHEKDFFLRKDLKYQTEFNNKINDFESQLASTSKTKGLDEVIKLLEGYREKFNHVVAIDSKIGLQSQDGIKGHLAIHFKRLKQSAQILRQAAKEKNAAFQGQIWTILIALFLVQLAAGMALAIFYSDQITSAVKEIQRGLHSFAQGKFPPKLNVRSHEEIGKTKVAFNHLLDRIQAAQQFAAGLGKGNLDLEYDTDLKHDLLAQSLITMQIQLKELLTKQRLTNWGNEGAAQLNELLKDSDVDVNLLGNQVIGFIVKYLNANQGAIYLIQKSGKEHWAERVATYAYGKKKFVEERIELGSGLVGQCLLEKQTIVLKQVPQGYLKITSGLGEATPRFVILVPLLVRDEIFGVIELASFEPLTGYEIEFLERIASNVASMLFNKQTAAETTALLHESQAYVSKLAQQEEVIRQNTEEMQAITEQLERDKVMLQEEIERMKFRLSMYEEVSSSN